MTLIDGMIEAITPFLPLAASVIIVGVFLRGAHWFLIARHPEFGIERLFPRQLAMLGLTLAGVIAIALTLPVSEGSRNQIIGLIGLIISGIFAFSSSTIFANLMAGIMLRVTNPFRTGDFINIKSEYFGRVVERGLLDTEIQTENRELVALPNTYMIGNPISVIRTSGAIVSITISLGYDVYHAKVEPLLIDAARECGLEEPFVHILELGNYAITYKVSGMLTDIKSLLTARSNLCRCVLHVLHKQGIEIMSPSFMSQRPVPGDVKIIPAMADPVPLVEVPVAENVVFDKAEEAEQTAQEKEQLMAGIEELTNQLVGATGEEKGWIEEKRKEIQGQLAAIERPAEVSGA